MNGEMHRLDDLFRERMEEHQEMPSPKVWDKIEEELDKKDRRNPFLFFIAHKKAITVFILGLLCAGLFWGKYYSENSLSNINQKNQDSVKENQIYTPEKDPETEQKTPLINKDQDTAKVKNGEKIADKDLGPDKPILTDNSKEEKENSINKPAATQPNLKSAHHINASLKKNIKNIEPVRNNLGFAENSKEQLIKQSLSNQAVANPPDVHESVPFKNKKTDVAGSPAIIQSAGKVNNNALAVQVIEEQTKLTLVAGVNGHQHVLGPIVNSVVTFKTQPNSVKTPTAFPAPATNVSSKKTDPTEKKSTKKNIYISLTPVLQKQFGKMRLVDIPPPPPQIPPIITFSRFKMEATDYQKSGGLYAGLHLGKKWSIQSGLLYSTQHFKTDTTKSEAVLRPDGNIKYMIENVVGSLYIDPARGDNPTAGSLVDVYKLTTAFSYIQFPLQLNYYFGKGKLQAFTTIGGTYNKLYKLSVTGVMMDLNAKHIITDKVLSLKTSYIHAVLGGGLQWNFYKNVSFLVSPQYHLSITPNYTSSDQKSYPNNITIQTGFQVGLHK